MRKMKLDLERLNRKSYSLDPNNPDANQTVMNMAFLFRFSNDETKYKEFVNGMKKLV